MSEEVSISIVTGAALAEVLPDLARLRISVFREWPYLYEGHQQYEERYLRTYADSPGSLIVLARAGARVIGASTAIPLIHEPATVQAPFVAAGIAIRDVFYLGESVLLPGYRGRGIGHAFFDEREACAHRSGPFRWTAFCAVDRPDDHPARPADARSLVPFWTGRGYVRRPDLQTTFEWKEVGEVTETAKPMTFWLKEWS